MGDLKKVTLFITYEDKMLERALPGVNDRKVRLDLFEQTGIRGFSLSLEVWDGRWYICSTREVRISENHQIIKEKELKEGCIFNGKIYSAGFRFQVRAAQLGKERTEFIKYNLQEGRQIELGHDPRCQIVLEDIHVSRRHAVIYYDRGRWYVEDRSKNGTYLNGTRVKAAAVLSYGDRLAIMDYQLIFLHSVLAINRASSVTSRLAFADKKQIQQGRMHAQREWFSRVPRFMEPFDTEEVEMEAPPTLNRQKRMPVYLTIGPSLTMPIPILLMVLFQIAVASQAGGASNPVTYVGMAISVIMFSSLGVMWTMLRKNYEESAENAARTEREQAYRAYIVKNEQLLQEKQRFNKRVLERIYLSSADLLALLSRNVHPLWNRNINHEDFLTVRLGTGPMSLPNKIKIPKQRFSIENDPLMALPRQVMKKYEMMEHTPKVVALEDHKIIGVVGAEEALYQISNALAVQAAALHSYMDVKMVFFMQPGNWQREWNWVKWLPHVFGEDKKIRFIANSEESWERVQRYLMQEIKLREELENESRNKGGNAIARQRYIVFVSNREQFNNSVLYQYMVSEKNIGFTFLLFYGHLSKLPNECRYIIEDTETFQGAYQLNEAIGRGNWVQFEGVAGRKAEPLARMMNRHVLQELGQSSLPNAIDYLSMLGIGRVEQWDLLKHYKENRSYEGIRAWLGMMPGDRPMYLDIHEKKHGPHGLIAGTTGSGKSELIQTFLLSLALNYHPSEVAFILIDYKGGGMAKIFEGIPHVAGILLNLSEDGEDQGQARRTLLSIHSEIERREKIFNQYQIQHIDDYIRLYREGKAGEPLPHLIIISDEFAELKKEQPEFIKELVSTARVGRSIGMHLILATQKPAGVVDDQITGNSRFKICLRVQDKSDSNEMLKRPEAAYLSAAGRAYFQLGNNELFELFQSGYSGAAYEPKEEAASADDEAVTMIQIDGSPAVEPQRKVEKDRKAVSQITACMRYIKKITREKGIAQAKPLWLQPLPKILGLDALKRQYDYPKDAVSAIVGLLDAPERQEQYPLSLDFSSFSNLMVIGNQGCGKSTLVQTILYALAVGYTAQEVNFYIFDFSSGLLRNFEYLPHCGVMAALEQEDQINRTMRYLTAVMEERDKLFQSRGVGSYWEYKKVSKDPLPLLFFVIDNFYAFFESYEKLEGALTGILRGGQRTGIQTIVTVNRMNDMKIRLRQNFMKMLPLQLNEKMDYTEAVGSSLDGFAASVKGRGLCLEGNVYEFQTALAVLRNTEFERVQVLTEEFKDIAAREAAGAKKILVIPQDETYETFIKKLPGNRLEKGIPLGYEQEQIEPYFVNWSEIFCYLISGVSEKAVWNLLCNFITYLQMTQRDIYYLNLSGKKPPECRKKACYSDEEDVFQMLLFLKEEFTKRNRRRKEYLSGRKEEADILEALLEEFRPLFFVMDDFGAFLDLVYKDREDEAWFPITELFFKEGRGLGIYFIGGLEAGKHASAPYTLAYKNYTLHSEGIHLGGQLNMQNLFRFPLPVSKQTIRLPDNVGCLMEKGTPYSIFIPWNKAKE